MRRFLFPLCLVLVCGCAAPVEDTSDPDSVTITGHILGAEGQPLERAHIASTRDIETGTYAAEDGSFSLQLSSAADTLRINGVRHRYERIPILAELGETVELEVRLAAPILESDPEKLTMVGDFGDYRTAGGVTMELQPDGSYTATLETEQEEIRYYIRGISSNPFGMQGPAERYEMDNRSLVAVLPVTDGRVEVRFDPSTLRAGKETDESLIAFANPSSVSAKVSQFQRKFAAQRKAYRNAYSEHRKSGSREPFEYDHSADLDWLEFCLVAEQNPTVRAYMALSGLQQRLKTGDAENVLDNVPPTSPIWTLVSPGIALRALEESLGEETIRAYVAELIDQHPNDSVRGFAMMMEMRRHQEGSEKFNELYDRAMAIEDENLNRMLQGRFSRTRPLAVGATVPSFTLTALDDPQTKHSDQSLAGSYYMLDFWGTWCGPCVADMPDLHEAYEKFSQHGFQILSVSVHDESPEKVRAFRRDKWPMPWLHGFVSEDEAEELVSNYFGVSGFPTLALVAPDGKIVAGNSMLRGEKLEATLERFLDE